MTHQGGAFLVIDYGYTLPGLGSTLQAVKGHEFADPFENPGTQDLTAHVNFVELANQAGELKSARDRLVEPSEMGSLFKVLAITHPDWPAPEGFAASV